MFTRLLFIKVARAASRNAASCALVGRAETSLPFSYAPSISLSYRSSFFICAFRSKVISRRLPARNDGLQKVVRALLDRMDKKNIVTIGHNQHYLSRISPLVRVDQNVLEPVFLDCENDFLEGNAAPGLQAFVLVRVPPERLHTGILAQCVPFVIRPPVAAWSRLTTKLTGRSTSIKGSQPLYPSLAFVRWGHSVRLVWVLVEHLSTWR